MIDLRSDTVTKPSPAMRRAMAEAVVGDDVFLEDPTINRLQSRAAQIFDREAALFVPSGSMGNLACVMAQTRPGQEVICETNGHVYNYEMGSLSAVGGVLPRIVDGEDGILSWSAIEAAIRPKVYYRPQTALICLENTVNMAGGTVYPTALAEEICERAHEREIHVHLDGARVFNAATYLKEDVADMTKSAAALFARCWVAACGRQECWPRRDCSHSSRVRSGSRTTTTRRTFSPSGSPKCRESC
jgi:threonine aldolase